MKIGYLAILLDNLKNLVKFKILLGIFLLAYNYSAAQTVEYEWAPEYYAKINGEEKLVFTWEFPSSKLATGNLLGDALPDLIVGNEAGTLSLYENIGTKDEPKFRLQYLRVVGYGPLDNEYSIFRDDAMDSTADIENDTISEDLKASNRKKTDVLRPFDFGARAAPALVNFRSKQQLDLLVGDAFGRLILILNNGTPENPKFEYNPDSSLIFSELAWQEMRLKNSVPAFCDLNNDDKPDLLVGSADGRVLVFLGQRDSKRYLYYKETPDFLLRLTYGKNAAPSCVDWEDNRQPAIVVGQKDGYLSYFRNIGQPLLPEFAAPEFFFYKIDAGGEAAPHFTTLSPQSQDLLLGSLSSKIKRFEFRNFDGAKNIWSINDNITNFERLHSFGKDTNITSGNLFGNNKQDLILGNAKGYLTMYRNDSDNNEVVLSKISDDLLPDLRIAGASPEVVDVVSDALPSLIVGSKGGQVYYFKNKGTAKNPDFKIANNNLVELDDVDLPILRAIDISQQGTFDLIVGGVGSNLQFFKNVGTGQDPEFTSETLDVILVDKSNTKRFNAPSLFNWNKFLVPNLVVGNSLGGLSVLNFDPKKISLLPDFPVDFQEYLAQPFEFPRWNYKKEMPDARPYFVDILNNGSQSMMVSNDKGDVLLFIQKQSQLIDAKSVFSEYQARKLQEKLERIREKLKNYKPKNIAPKFVLTADTIIAQSVVQKPVPYLGNLRQDDLTDLVIGSQDGSIKIYHNVGTSDVWRFELAKTLTLPNKEKGAAPLLVDLDDDGDLDLLSGSRSGRLFYFENVALKPSYKFELRADYFKKIKLGRNTVPSRVYVKGKSLPEIVVGDVNGNLALLRNLSFYDDGVFRALFDLQNRSEFSLQKEFSAAPRFEDLNNDGVPEMIIGNDQGFVNVYIYNDNPEDGDDYWRLMSDWSLADKFGFRAVPAFGDLHGSGVKDMLVAFENGEILLFRNDAVTPELLEKLEKEELKKN